MSTSDSHRRPPFKLSPAEEACLRIIHEYREAPLALEAAAPQLLTAMQANPRGLNLETSPSVRRLLAEVQRLAGAPSIPTEADPDRHAEGGREMLSDLDAWVKRGLATHSHAAQPLSIRCTFGAASQSAAERLKAWLEEHGGHRVSVESPQEADSDDWELTADSPLRVWSDVTVDEWVGWIRQAPCGGEASFRGCSL